MGMAGLRDFVVVTPASFNYHQYHHNQTQDPIMENDQINGRNTPTALGIGVIPLSRAPRLAPKNVENPDLLNNNGGTGMQLWRLNQTSSQNLKKSSLLPHNNSSSSVNLIQSGGGSGGSGSSTRATCQDCGNQAKKDCSYRRCRTCCKSRSFDCPTHVKSTWVPATRRRERQVMAAGATTGLSAGPNKKLRLTTSQIATTSHTSTSNATPPRSFETSSTPQNAGSKDTLPAQVNAPAIFKCVRVTAVQDGEDEFAYEAVVEIGGHVFKGLLYDQGVDIRDGFPDISELNLGGGSNGGGGGGSSEVFEAVNGGGLLGGSEYGHPIN